MQVGVEDGHRFKIEDLVHQLGQLRPRLHMKVHLQGAASEFIEVVHLAAPRLSLASVAGHPRRKAADDERHQIKTTSAMELPGRLP